MSEQPLVGVVMGSKSDYETLSAAVEILRALEIAHETRIVSAHRTPDWLFKYAEMARGRGLRAIIAVSYTHLDVYKRQLSDRIDRKSVV